LQSGEVTEWTVVERKREREREGEREKGGNEYETKSEGERGCWLRWVALPETKFT